MIVAKQRLQLFVNKSMFGAVVGSYSGVNGPFRARQHNALYAITRPSVYLSVCLSVTRVDQSKMAEVRVTLSAYYIPLVFAS